jgi:hypothetical protein
MTGLDWIVAGLLWLLCAVVVLWIALRAPLDPEDEEYGPWMDSDHVRGINNERWRRPR